MSVETPAWNQRESRWKRGGRPGAVGQCAGGLRLPWDPLGRPPSVLPPTLPEPPCSAWVKRPLTAFSASVDCVVRPGAPGLGVWVLEGPEGRAAGRAGDW